MQLMQELYFMSNQNLDQRFLLMFTRKDSQSTKTDVATIKGNFTLSATYLGGKDEPIILHPGMNTLNLSAKVKF